MAGVALVASIGMLAMARNGGSGLCPSPVSLGGPYGNGPYRDTSAEPDEKIVASLAELVEKLRGIPEGQGPRIDWPALDKSVNAAKAAGESRDFCAAIRQYAEVLRAVMHQFRQHRLTITDDSGVYRA